MNCIIKHNVTMLVVREMVPRWQLELYDRLAGLHSADIRENEVEMEKRARAVRVQQVMVVY